MEKNKSCKKSRWQIFKSQLNNLATKEFETKSKQIEDSFIIDVRTPEEYHTGHIPKAINLDYLAEAFWDDLEALDISKTKTYFIYCRSGRRSIRVCTLMRNGGYDANKIFNLDNGFPDWLAHFPNKVVRVNTSSKHIL